MVFDSLRDDIEKDAYVDYFGTGSLMGLAFFCSVCLKPKMLDVRRKGSARKVSVEFNKALFPSSYGPRNPIPFCSSLF